jgi:hypothetical protein
MEVSPSPQDHQASNLQLLAVVAVVEITVVVEAVVVV